MNGKRLSTKEKRNTNVNLSYFWRGCQELNLRKKIKNRCFLLSFLSYEMKHWGTCITQVIHVVLLPHLFHLKNTFKYVETFYQIVMDDFDSYTFWSLGPYSTHVLDVFTSVYAIFCTCCTSDVGSSSSGVSPL